MIMTIDSFDKYFPGTLGFRDSPFARVRFFQLCGRSCTPAREKDTTFSSRWSAYVYVLLPIGLCRPGRSAVPKKSHAREEPSPGDLCGDIIQLLPLSRSGTATAHFHCLPTNKSPSGTFFEASSALFPFHRSFSSREKLLNGLLGRRKELGGGPEARDFRWFGVLSGIMSQLPPYSTFRTDAKVSGNSLNFPFREDS